VAISAVKKTAIPLYMGLLLAFFISPPSKLAVLSVVIFSYERPWVEI
jgi:hypothetical protein